MNECFALRVQQEEEMQGLQKRIQQLEGDLDQAQTQLEEATQKLENTEKQLSNVSDLKFAFDCKNKYVQCRFSCLSAPTQLHTS